MDFRKIVKRLENEPKLHSSAAYIIVALDSDHQDWAFLLDALKVYGSNVKLLRCLCTPAYEPKVEIMPIPLYPKDEEHPEFGNELDEEWEESQKPRRAQATIYEGNDWPLLSFHLNRDGDGLVKLSDDHLHTVPLVYWNAGARILKVAGKPVAPDHYLVHTTDTFERAERKAAVQASMVAFMSQPDTVEAINAVMEESRQRL